MKNVAVLFFVVFSLLFFIVNPVFAHPGNTASDGCHYCWTNCDYWGEVYGARHCHGGGSYSPPSYDYSPPSYDCPVMSYYDSLSGSCKCYSGYVASGDKCISENQWCEDKYGYGATSDYLDGCKCKYGYVLGKDFLGNTKCILGSQACRDEYGVMATYDSLSKKCSCMPGYVFGTNIIGTTQCISEDDWCEDKYGYNSKYNTLKDKCECKSGYEFTISGSSLKCESCFSIYGLHSSYNYLGNKCECDDGYILDGSECIKEEEEVIITCPINSTLISGQCFCNSGYVNNNNSCTKVVEIKKEDEVVKKPLFSDKEANQDEESSIEQDNKKESEQSLVGETENNEAPPPMKGNLFSGIFMLIKNIFSGLFK